MAEHAEAKRGNPNWVKGGPSPNPKGRPRTGLAAAEKIRELVDPAEWIAFELETARDTTASRERRSAAWHALIDRGFIKPPMGIDANVTNANASQLDWSKATDEQIRDFVGVYEALLRSADNDGSPADTELPRDATRTETASDDAPIADAATVPPTIVEVKP